MVELITYLPALIVLTGIAGAFILPALGTLTSRRVCELYAAGVSLAMLLESLIMFNYLIKFGGFITHFLGGWPPPIGITYVADTYAAFITVVITSVVLAITLYSLWYMRSDDGVCIYYTLFTHRRSRYDWSPTLS